MNKETKFKVGDKAHKPKGYKFPCTIVGVFETIAGEVRVIGEMDEYGLLHIFNENQLEHYGKDEPDLLNEAYMGYYWTMGDKIKLTKDEFIKKCKTNPEFSEKWGLTIEEKVLDNWNWKHLKQRAYGYNNLLESHPKYNPKWHSKIKDIDKLSEGELMTILQSLPTPTKLITITYQDQTIESYE